MRCLSYKSCTTEDKEISAVFSPVIEICLRQFGVNCLVQGQTSHAVNGDRTQDPLIQSLMSLPLGLDTQLCFYYDTQLCSYYESMDI